jgi:hypothetical protein
MIQRINIVQFSMLDTIRLNKLMTKFKSHPGQRDNSNYDPRLSIFVSGSVQLSAPLTPTGRITIHFLTFWRQRPTGRITITKPHNFQISKYSTTPLWRLKIDWDFRFPIPRMRILPMWETNSYGVAEERLLAEDQKFCRMGLSQHRAP